MDKPDYLNQSEDQIRERMLSNIPADLDKTEGSYIYDAISPAAIELVLISLMANGLLANGFASTAASSIPGFRSPYLDLRGEEHGVLRNEAVKAAKQNGVKFSGTAGVIIPVGTIVATPADSITNTPSIEFETTKEAIIDVTGNTYADIKAVEGGTSGNVAAGAISVLVSQIDGISGVTNPEPISGGIDTEEDPSYLARYLQRVRNPSSSGNRADYVAWAMEVPGVGGVSVIPVRDGPGTVSVAILDTEKAPADQGLVDTAQNYIAPPHILTQEAELMVQSGFGVSIDDTQTDDIGTSVKMVYDAGGNGVLSYQLDPILPQPGIWQARIRIKASDITGITDCLEIGVWNLSGSAWSKTKYANGEDACKILKANELSLPFSDQIVEFYWNGQDHIELRMSRLSSDVTTQIWVDQVVMRSTFSKETGDGKAPIGARVTVEPAKVALINVSATLVIPSGYNKDSVISAATENIRAYIKSLAFAQDNDVRYVRISEKILDTTGIYDYSNLLVNGGTANIAIGEQDVAVLGTVNFTT